MKIEIDERTINKVNDEIESLRAERDKLREDIKYFFVIHDTTACTRDDYECVAKLFRKALTQDGGE